MRSRLRGLGEILGGLAEAEKTLAQMAGLLLARNFTSEVTVPVFPGEPDSAAVQEVTGAVLIADSGGRLAGATVDAAELVGYDSQILSRSHVTDLFEMSQSAWEALRIQAEAQPGPADARMLQCKRGDGSVIQMAVRVAALSVDGNRNYALTLAGARAANGAREARGVHLARARYQAIVEQIPAITFMASLDGKANDLYVSPQIEALLGFTQREWLEDPTLWFRQLHPEDREKLHQEFSRGLFTGGPFRAEVRVFARNGEIVWVRGEARLVKDSNGRPLFFQGVAFDISEAKRAEQQLEEAHRATLRNERLAVIGQLAASISHDLRNPLGSIRNAWYYIRRKLEASQISQADPRIERLAGVIESELGRCVAIIGDLLDFTRDPPLRRAECNLQRIIEEGIAAAGSGSAVRIAREYCAGLPTAYLDQTRFRQVVINLLENALHAVDPVQGVITVRAARENDHLLLEIQDNGKGMTPEVRERIFEPLFTTKTKGTGLGLCIVNNIVRSHSGTISVDSAPGQGTKFQIRIPVEKPGSAGALH
jgi:PAS domain S-box-containing protein